MMLNSWIHPIEEKTTYRHTSPRYFLNYKIIGGTPTNKKYAPLYEGFTT